MRLPNRMDPSFGQVLGSRIDCLDGRAYDALDNLDTMTMLDMVHLIHAYLNIPMGRRMVITKPFLFRFCTIVCRFIYFYLYKNLLSSTQMYTAHKYCDITNINLTEITEWESLLLILGYNTQMTLFNFFRRYYILIFYKNAASEHNRSNELQKNICVDDFKATLDEVKCTVLLTITYKKKQLFFKNKNATSTILFSYRCKMIWFLGPLCLYLCETPIFFTVILYLWMFVWLQHSGLKWVWIIATKSMYWTL